MGHCTEEVAPGRDTCHLLGLLFLLTTLPPTLYPKGGGGAHLPSETTSKSFPLDGASEAAA